MLDCDILNNFLLKFQFLHESFTYNHALNAAAHRFSEAATKKNKLTFILEVSGIIWQRNSQLHQTSPHCSAFPCTQFGNCIKWYPDLNSASLPLLHLVSLTTDTSRPVPLADQFVWWSTSTSYGMADGDLGDWMALSILLETKCGGFLVLPESCVSGAVINNRFALKFVQKQFRTLACVI